MKSCDNCNKAKVLSPFEYYWCVSNDIPITARNKELNRDRAERCLQFCTKIKKELIK